MMNEQELQRATAEAYEISPVSAEVRSRIRQSVNRVPRRRLTALRLASLSTALALVVVSIPVARANYLGYSFARKLRDPRAFTVRISVKASHASLGGETRSTPLVATVADGVCTMTESDEGTFYLFEGERVTKYNPHDARAIVRPSDPSWVNLLSLPNLVADQLGTFQLDRKVSFGGKVVVAGVELDQWVLNANGVGKLTFLVDPASGQAKRMEIEAQGRMPAETFEYDHDEEKARSEVAARLKSIRTAPKLDLAEALPQFSRQMSATPLFWADLPRDRLGVYRIESNAEGDIFVLYTLDGKHSGEDNFGNLLRVEDADGTPWLSDVIDLSFSKLKLNAQFAKAQVFFHPKTAVRAKAVRLYAKMWQGEFARDQVAHPISDNGSVRRDFGVFPPVATVFRQPDWLYLSFSGQDSDWLSADARKLRFLAALRDKDFALAQRIGTDLEAHFPVLMPAFFYSRADLSLALYHAFRGTGSLATARDYLRKAIRQSGGQGDHVFLRDLNEARKNEGI